MKGDELDGWFTDVLNCDLEAGKMTSVEVFWAAYGGRAHCKVEPPAHPTYDIVGVVQAALREDDADEGDATCEAIIPEGTHATAAFLAKADGVLAGAAVADVVFAMCGRGIYLEWEKGDGDRVAKGDVFARVSGDARGILRAERVALNFLQRMSGIATATAAMVAACEGTKARVLDTRKTAPGLRLLDKWAVVIGGGRNHRMGLFDMIMVKDNHIAAAGGVKKAVDLARGLVEGLDDRLPIEVETRTLEEVADLVACLSVDKAGYVTRVMLDNMAVRDESADGGVDVSMLKEALGMVGGRVETEASGNVTLDTIGAIAKTGVDFISSGALTHSVTCLDISFNIKVDQK